MGKPIPKAQVMRFLKSKEYTDAKDFAGECESVVVVAKGQSKHVHSRLLYVNHCRFLTSIYIYICDMQVCKAHASTGHVWTTYWLPPILRTSSCRGHTRFCLPKEHLIIT